VRTGFWLQIETRNQQTNTLETTKTRNNQFGAIIRVFTETLETRKLEMRREERRDLPMEWMRVRDSSSSFRISIFGRNDYRGGALSLSHSLVLSSHLAETGKGKEMGCRKEKERGERKR
jgi:hypothetical protein